ncbi:fibrinogen alpha chain-like protein [Lates japonicus]|uniref:Fibrinogen alpha chain-like protein n=1 Tax=Lates japonicus TaxID=270547 RepID=A0AAD3RH64_LATJO|nr:fibrinogen alpha chain-like protein [Lates japonicus]
MYADTAEDHDSDDNIYNSTEYSMPRRDGIQGLMDKYDHNLLKIEKIHDLLDKNKVATVLPTRCDNYYDLAQNLRQRITDMKIRNRQTAEGSWQPEGWSQDQLRLLCRIDIDVAQLLQKDPYLVYEYNVDQEAM